MTTQLFGEIRAPSRRCNSCVELELPRGRALHISQRYSLYGRGILPSGSENRALVFYEAESRGIRPLRYALKSFQSKKYTFLRKNHSMCIFFAQNHSKCAHFCVNFYHIIVLSVFVNLYSLYYRKKIYILILICSFVYTARVSR